MFEKYSAEELAELEQARVQARNTYNRAKDAERRKRFEAKLERIRQEPFDKEIKRKEFFQRVKTGIDKTVKQVGTKLNTVMKEANEQQKRTNDQYKKNPPWWMQ